MKLILIAKSNLKRKKSDMVVLVLLVALATLLLYMSISVLFQLGNVLDKTNSDLNGASSTLISPSVHTEEIIQIMNEAKAVESVEAHDCLKLSGFQYHKGGETAQTDAQYDFMMEDMSAVRSISKLHILEKAETIKENAIVLPYYMKVALGYQTGDTLILKNGAATYKFSVAGFTENIMFSTPTNLFVFKCYTTTFAMDQMRNQNGVNLVKTYNAELKEEYSSQEFEDYIIGKIGEEIKDFPYLNNSATNYEISKSSTAMTANILMIVVAVFAILLIVIAIVLIRFSIHNSIERNLKNIGVWQASGYTSIQLQLATVLEIMIVVVSGTSFGLLLSGGASGIIGNLVASSIGLMWKQNFSWKSGLFSALVICSLVLCVVILTSWKYKQITPLTALREGFTTHNFKKNSLPLDQVVLPLDSALGIKNIWNEKRKSAAICFIALVLSLTCNMGLSLWLNMASSGNKLIELTGLETPTTMVTLDGKIQKSVDEIKKELEALDETDEIICMTQWNINISHREKETVSFFEIYDHPSRLRANVLIEGRMPKYENEVLLSSLLCKQLGVTSGDVVYLEMKDKSAEFIISGISQHINHMGRKGIITFEGAERLVDGTQPTALNVYGKTGVSYERIEQEYKKIFPQITMVDMVKTIDISFASVKNSMTSICILFVACTMGVVALVIFFLIKSKVIRETKSLGIWKALGFTTGQLMRQMVISYVPVIGVGAILGSVAAYFAIEPVMVLALSFCGIRKCSMDASLLYSSVSVVGIVVTATVVALLCAWKIRKIVPWKMLQE